MDVNKPRGLSGIELFMPLYDDTFFDFFPTKQSQEIQKVVDRYIKKSKHKVFIVSTKNRNNKT